MRDHSYSYKIEDYGGGKFQFVISKNGKESFHSNGYEKKFEAEKAAQEYIESEKFSDESQNKGFKNSREYLLSRKTYDITYTYPDKKDFVDVVVLNGDNRKDVIVEFHKWGKNGNPKILKIKEHGK